jgi:hypothetical protein
VHLLVKFLGEGYMHMPQFSLSESQCGFTYENKWICGVKQGRIYLLSTACAKILFIWGPKYQPSFIFECTFFSVRFFFFASSATKIIVESARRVIRKITGER